MIITYGNIVLQLYVGLSIGNVLITPIVCIINWETYCVIQTEWKPISAEFLRKIFDFDSVLILVLTYIVYRFLWKFFGIQHQTL